MPPAFPPKPLCLRHKRAIYLQQHPNLRASLVASLDLRDGDAGLVVRYQGGLGSLTGREEGSHTPTLTPALSRAARLFPLSQYLGLRLLRDCEILHSEDTLGTVGTLPAAPRLDCGAQLAWLTGSRVEQLGNNYPIVILGSLEGSFN